MLLQARVVLLLLLLVLFPNQVQKVLQANEQTHHTEKCTPFTSLRTIVYQLRHACAKQVQNRNIT